MKLLILSRSPAIHSTRRLLEACEDERMDVVVADPLDLALFLPAGGKAAIHSAAHSVAGVDLVLPRIGTNITEYGLAVLHHFELMGVPVLNDSSAVYRARDKLRSLQVLSARGVPVPPTLMARSPESIEWCIEQLGGPPVVLKLLQGTQGVGVMLAESLTAAEAILDAMWGLGQNILVQKFIAESRGTDLRCIVVGDRVVAAMRRVARTGSFRSNIHRGGRGEGIHPVPKDLERVALEASRALGLRISGVDMLDGKEGPLVTEVNVSPGLEGIEAATRKDVAREMIRYARKFATAARRSAR
ncbi:MAG: RimK family alpha-L-glutamate ligase [Planctomycetaceae bacterium]|nr:RimK family alpha-L-glutamate ligase [Planctomycetaceae bacterium]